MQHGSPDQVIEHVRSLIESGGLRPGDRLPAERRLAASLGVSRPTVRVALHALAAMGVIISRHGSGTYIPEGPPALGSGPLDFLAALHGFTAEEMYEARRILEVGAAALAALRTTPEQMAGLAEEVASLYASVEDPPAFLVHDIRFHRLVGAASGNPIVAALMEMLAEMHYQRRKDTVQFSSETSLRGAAAMHRRIYQAIRAGDAEAARAAMDEHLLQAGAEQAQEPRSG
jgi:GntR family transcriptional repressor for pyruvate dehydrogenase complex